MAKNILKLLLVSFVVCSLSSCGVKTEDWTIIWIDDEVSIKVPNDWVLTKIDGKIVFSDCELSRSDVKIYMIEVSIYAKTPSDIPKFNGPLINGEMTKKLSWEMYSNSTIYSVYEVKIGNIGEVYRFLEFDWRDGMTDFIVVDNSIRKNIIKAILDSKRS